MLKIYTFVCFIGLVFANSPNEKRQIVFQINDEYKENRTYMYCDHDKDKGDIKNYTVNEGEQYHISIQYRSFINDIICVKGDTNKRIDIPKTQDWTISTFTAEKQMYGPWKCSILSHVNIDEILPRVRANGQNTYAGAYCYMNIRVRQKKPPQTILVNNMVLAVTRSRWGEPDWDFTSEYRYAAGDLVNVTCANFYNKNTVTISYPFADKLSDQFNSSEVTTSEAAGFIAEMHLEHNNTFMTCTCKGDNDNIIVMVKFLLGEFENNMAMTVNINGMHLRFMPNENNYSEIEYKFTPGQSISVVCEKKRPDALLQIIEMDDLKQKGANKTELEPHMKWEVSFKSSESFNQSKFRCGLDTLEHTKILLVEIKFSVIGQLPPDAFPIGMELSSKGTAMELYYYKKQRVIYYDFDVGEIFNFTCKRFFVPRWYTDPITKLHLFYLAAESINKSHRNSNIEHSFELSQKFQATVIFCYLKVIRDNDEDQIIREVRVILREKPVTTTSSSTTSTTQDYSEVVKSTSSPEPQPESAEDPSLLYKISGVIVGVVAIIIICVSTVITMTRKKNQAQRGPHNPNYENLQNPREAAIPAFPPQWDSQYAVPVDRRPEDTTYSLPFQPEAAYATAIPKSQRNQKNMADPTYAVLDIKNDRSKNMFKETEDPNYSEVYANRKEQCYAEVLPKVLRDKFKRDNNPYVNVGNESPYVNTVPEPMYCEPNVAKNNSPYANVNSEHYANSRANEYVEPTYCEPPVPKARVKKSKR